MTESYADAARRHFRDAEHLAASRSLDGAGYLIGYAVECAIKKSVESTRPTAEAPHCHLPDLVERAKKLLHGRRQQQIFVTLKTPNLMVGWSVDLRYEASQTVSQETYDRWRNDASRVLAAAGLKRSTR
jgi:hypothetical protein